MYNQFAICEIYNLSPTPLPPLFLPFSLHPFTEVYILICREIWVATDLCLSLLPIPTETKLSCLILLRVWRRLASLPPQGKHKMIASSPTFNTTCSMKTWRKKTRRIWGQHATLKSWGHSYTCIWEWNLTIHVFFSFSGWWRSLCSWEFHQWLQVQLPIGTREFSENWDSIRTTPIRLLLSSQMKTSKWTLYIYCTG